MAVPDPPRERSAALRAATTQSAWLGRSASKELQETALQALGRLASRLRSDALVNRIPAGHDGRRLRLIGAGKCVMATREPVAVFIRAVTVSSAVVAQERA
jgi:hypothetical protein